MVQSDIRAMTRECNRIGGINLGQSLCDIEAPTFVKEAGINAIRQNRNLYSLAEGIKELRQTISKKLERDNAISANPETEIVVTVGATGAFTSTVNALLNLGDGILLFEPFYGYHQNISRVAGLDLQYITLFPPDFSFTKEKLQMAVQPNTRAIVICTPANPSGKVFTSAELHIIYEVAEEHDLLVITDEIYEYICYDGRQHVSPATIGNMWNRTVTIMGFSKTFSIAGWRLGYAVAQRELLDPIRLVNDTYYCCSPVPLQHGIAEAYLAPPTFFEELRTSYQIKRNMLFEALQMGGMSPILPQGAYYIFTDISKLGLQDARSAAMALLENVKVASVPGTAFYNNSIGENFLRFCFAVEFDVLEEACRRIRAANELQFG